jgi:zinc finger protein 830
MPQQQEHTAAPSAAPDTQPAAATATSAPAEINEDEWAAFEADLIHGSAPTTTAKPLAAAALDSDAVISAPAMSAAEVAAKSEEEERARRKALVDIQLEDEKEDATRALEDEFDVMEELEARAKRLRERREALRVQGNGGAAPAAAASDEGKGAAPGKENAAVEEEEEDEEDDEDDWNGFRFRA